MPKIAEKLALCGVTQEDVLDCLRYCDSRSARDFVIRIANSYPVREARYDPHP